LERESPAEMLTAAENRGNRNPERETERERELIRTKLEHECCLKE